MSRILRIIRGRKKHGAVSNPNPLEGLFGLMIASLLNDRSNIPQSLTQEDTEKAKNKQEMKLQIISEFDEAKEQADYN